MFIAAVLVILIGVVMATNYVNNQNLSTKSRADEPANALLGGAGTPTPGATVAMSLFKLSELKTRASATVQSLANMLRTSAVLSNSKQLEDAKSAITANVSSAEKALTDTKKELGTLGDLVTAKKTALGGDLLAATTKVSAKEALLATAKTNTKQAQDDRDEDAKNLKNKQDELDKKLADAEPAKNAVNSQRKIMDNAVTALLSNNTSSDPNNDDTLTGLRAAKDITDTDKYIESLKNLESNVSAAVIFSDTEKFRFSPSLEALITAQATYKSWEVTPAELSAANATINLLKISLDQSAQKLVDAIGEENKVAIELLDEQNKESVVKQMTDSVTAFEGALKTFSGSLSETSVLPGQLSKLALPSPDYGVSTVVIADINTGVDKVNGALLATSSSYDALDKTITDADKNKGAQTQSYEKYCKDLQKAYFPNDPEDGENAIVPLTLDGSDGWAQTYYDGTNPLGLGNCKQYENQPAWNGKWGSEARCYTATGMCKRGSACNTVDCLTRIDNVIACINKEVDLSKCTGAVPPTAPKDVLQAGFSCPPGGVENYFERDGKLYLTNGEMFTQSTKKFCMNKLVADTDAATVAKARSFIADASKKNYGFCIPTENYVWDGATYEYSTTIASGVPATKKSLKKFRTCYAKNVNSLTNVACDTSTMVDDQYCQCTEQGYTFSGGNTKCPFFVKK